MSELGWLCAWLRDSPGTRRLRNGWIDESGELHIFTEDGGRPGPGVTVAQDRGILGSCQVTLEVRDGVHSDTQTVQVPNDALHRHALEQLWSSRAIVPRFEPSTSPRVLRWLPLTAQGLQWLLEAGLDPASCLEHGPDGRVCLAQIPGMPLSSRTFLAEHGTLEEALLSGWPAELPPWRAPWYVDGSSQHGSVRVAAVSRQLGREAMRAGARGVEFQPDEAPRAWIALVDGGAPHPLDAEAVTFVEVALGRRPGAAGARPERALKSDSRLVIDADPHAARLWIDGFALGTGGAARKVPLPPGLTSRFPFGDWFVHSLASEASSPNPSREARLGGLARAAEAAVNDVICGVDDYYEQQTERSGAVKVVLSHPIGAAAGDLGRAIQGALRTLRLASQSASVFAPALRGLRGEDKLELSTPATTGAGFLRSSASGRHIRFAVVVDLRGFETQLACVASVTSSPPLPPVCVAQEVLHVGLFHWARPWLRDDSRDIIADALQSLSHDEARVAATRFHEALLAVVGAFVTSVLTSPEAIRIALHEADGVELAAWGPDSVVTVLLDGWGVAPLWQHRELRDLPLIDARTIGGALWDAVRAGTAGTKAEGVEVRVQPPEPHGTRYLRDAYDGDYHAVTPNRPGVGYGPLGFSAVIDGQQVFDSADYFTGNKVGDPSLDDVRLQWRPSAAFVRAKVASHGALEGVGRPRLPWAVAAEQALLGLVAQETAAAAARRAERQAMLKPFEGHPGLAGAWPALSDWLLRAEPHALKEAPLERLGVSSEALRRSVSAALRGRAPGLAGYVPGGRPPPDTNVEAREPAGPRASAAEDTVIYGIDLGTTYTKCALAEGAGVHVFGLDVEVEDLMNPPGEGRTRRLPGLRSSVTVTTHLGHSEVHVGNRAVVARERLRHRDPHLVSAEEAKLYIGTKYEESEGAPLWIVGDHELRPEEIGALVLRMVAHEVERAGRPRLSRAVVTHPAQFDATQQQATRHAAALAGIEVVDLLSEPEAAAIAYSRTLQRDGRYLIFDLGGGTLDLVLVEIRDRQFRTLGKSGQRTGGRDFDRLVRDEMCSQFRALTDGVFDAERHLGHTNEMVWMALAERIKRALNAPDAIDASRRLRVTVPFDSTFVVEQGAQPLPASFVFEWSRSDFDQQAASSLRSCRSLAEEFLSQHGVSSRSLDGVISVGGSTRLRCVEQLIDALSGGRNLKRLDPETVVAQGAALHAASLRGGAPMSVGDLIKRTPYRGRLLRAVGIQVLDPDRRPTLETLVPANTETPLERPVERTFTTDSPNQSHILVRLYEGPDREPESPENNFIGECRIDGFTPSPELQSVTIRLQIEGNDAKRLTVMVAGFEREVPIVFDPSRVLGQEQLKRRRELLDGLRLRT